MSIFALSRSKTLQQVAGMFLLSAALASCGGSSSGTDQNGKAPETVLKQAESDYRTRSTPGLFLIAGSPGGPGSLDGKGSAARFNQPAGLVSDNEGNIFVADSENHVVRKLDKNGVVTTLAGKPGQAGNVDGSAVGARFAALSALAIDGTGHVYVADRHALRKISPQGTVATLAGAQESSGSSDGSSRNARFSRPLGIAVDGSGTVYVADSGNHSIRKISPDGQVSTIAGAPGDAGFADGDTSQARFNDPAGIALDGRGNLYVADRGNRAIRMISADGMVSTLRADSSIVGPSSLSGDAIVLDGPQGIAIGSDGMLYVTDARNAGPKGYCVGHGSIRVISLSGRMTTFAGTSKTCGSEDGHGTHARFNFPTGITMTPAGELFVSDTHNHTIRKITEAGYVSTAAGMARQVGHADGAGSDARFVTLTAIAADGSGMLYSADVGYLAGENSALIRTIASNTRVATHSGQRGAGYADGSIDSAQFDRPNGLTFDRAGNLYIADTYNAVIRKISPNGLVTTLAGLAGVRGSIDGTGSSARFHFPAAIAADGLGNLIVADICHDTDGAYGASIRKISQDGAVSTIAGQACEGGSNDGIGAVARFIYPSGIAVDRDNAIFITDSLAHTVRRISKDGMVTTIAGMPGTSGDADGTTAVARFNSPAGLAIDEDGNLYIADTLNHAVRMLDRQGRVLTIAGTAGTPGTVSWELPANLYQPTGIVYLGTGLFAVTSGGSILGLKLP